MKNLEIVRNKFIDMIKDLSGKELLEITDLLTGSKYECTLFPCETCRVCFGECDDQMREENPTICDSRFEQYCNMESSGKRIAGNSFIESRIIVIDAYEHGDNYWYEIDNSIKANRGVLYEAQERSGKYMRIHEGDEVYLLCKYRSGAEIKYKCIVEKTDISYNSLPLKEKNDIYAHSKNEYQSEFYFKTKVLEQYEDGNFPREELERLKLIKGTYLNGNHVQEDLLNYIIQNKRIVK